MQLVEKWPEIVIKRPFNNLLRFPKKEVVNVRSVKKVANCSIVLLLCLVSFFTECKLLQDRNPRNSYCWSLFVLVELEKINDKFELSMIVFSSDFTIFAPIKINQFHVALVQYTPSGFSCDCLVLDSLLIVKLHFISQLLFWRNIATAICNSNQFFLMLFNCILLLFNSILFTPQNL